MEIAGRKAKLSARHTMRFVGSKFVHLVPKYSVQPKGLERKTCFLLPMVAGRPARHLKAGRIMSGTISTEDLKGQVNKQQILIKGKGGAPKKRIRREVHVKVRLTTTERFLIESKARQAGMRISDWFREATLKAKVMARMNAEDRRVLHMLTGMANNLNQLTKLAHSSGMLTIAIRCRSLLTEIDQALKYFNSDDGKDT